MGSHLIREGLSDTEALLQACWQVVAFTLPLVQHEASGRWGAPPGFNMLHLTDLLSPTDASSPRDFQTVREGKTLALAGAMQACANVAPINPVGWEDAWDLPSSSADECELF